MFAAVLNSALNNLVDLTGNMGGSLGLDVSGQATFSPPPATLVEVPLNGFSIAGYGSLKPRRVTGEADV